ncbi:LOW QUALITY PROTEIN: hypothetical protein HID58_047887 [Brassica napus]|uniref:Uncharacterized protein n=1 Tax=Brassica napus TaxID=3708 RepID=A0ABQ8B0N3_BRANA|nr:LOW QUALITY PROTEIN: hypothetical protein HID58_047887 [Brassica napus]
MYWLVAVLTAAEQDLVISKAYLERQGGHWLGRLLGFYCRSLVQAVLLWSRRLPVKRWWRVTVCLTLWLWIWRLVSTCRPLFQICNEGVCVVTLGSVSACEMLYVFYRSSLPLEAHRSSYGGRVFTELSLVMCVLFFPETVKNRLWFEKGKEVLLLCSSSVVTLTRSRLIRRSHFFEMSRDGPFCFFKWSAGELEGPMVIMIRGMLCLFFCFSGSRLIVNGDMTSTRYENAVPKPSDTWRGVSANLALKQLLGLILSISNPVAKSSN